MEEELEYEIPNFELFGKYGGEIPKTGQPYVEYVHLARFPGYDKFNQKEGRGMVLVEISMARERLKGLNYEKYLMI